MVDAGWIPVPGSEVLRWVGEPLLIERLRSPVLVGSGRDVSLVCRRSSDGGEALVSHRLIGAFDDWPPTLASITASAEHARGMLFEGPLEAMGWPEGALAVLTSRGLLGIEAAPKDAMVTASLFLGSSDDAVHCGVLDDGDLLLEQRSGASLAASMPVGRLPLAARYARGVVSADGAAWFGVVERRDPGAMVDIMRAEAGRLRCLGSFPCATAAHLLGLEQLVARPDGSVWFMFSGRTGVVAQCVHPGGELGASWTTRYALMPLGPSTFAPWGEGFVVAIVKDSIVLLAADGVATTRVLGVPGGEAPLRGGCAVTCSPDGRSVLVAYATASGVQIARADFERAEVPLAEDPWATPEPIAVAESQPRDEAEEDEEEEEDESQPLFDPEARPGARQAVIAQVRLQAILSAFTDLYYELDESTFRGNADAGSYVSHNGQGDFMVFVWNAKGVVATSFDHEQNDEYDVPLEDRRPMRHFGKLPRSLAALARKAIRLAQGDVTGGLWVTDKGGRCGGQLVNLLDFTAAADQALAGQSPPQDWLDMGGELALRLAQASSVAPVTLSPEDAEFLIQTDNAPTPEGAALAAKKLGALGIVWSEPLADVERFSGSGSSQESADDD